VKLRDTLSSQVFLKFRSESFVTLFVCGVLFCAVPAQAVLKLTPQSVVDLALKQGLDVKNTELTAQLSYYGLSQALGAYDFNIDIEPGYTYNEAENLTESNDAIDKTFNLDVILQKRFITGTTLSVQYMNTRQSATFNSFQTTTRLPTSNLNSLQLGLRQNLLNNSFGYSERLALEAAHAAVDSALENREESLEVTLLNVMTLYWNAYISEQSFQENLSAREKYAELIRNVRRKAGFNLSAPGELPRLEAEQEATESRVKSSSAKYLNAVQALLTELRLETKEQIVLDVPVELPPVPQLVPKSTDDLRIVHINKTNLDVADKTLSSVRSKTLPVLDLIATATTTGVDPNNSEAVSEMAGTTKPTYYIGLQFTTPISSTAYRGQVADATVRKSIAENNYLAAVDTAKQTLDSTARQVLAQYSVAKLSGDVVDRRERVVRELEVAYRQGRQPLVELIRSYNDLFSAQLDRATAVGQYHIGLNQLAAARDELVTTAKK
jgi:outer membrane protein TolC